MTLLALVKDPDLPGQLTNISLEDCLYIETNKRVILYHHKNGKTYSSVSMLADLMESDFIKEMTFARMDNSNFVNLSKVKAFDSHEGCVFFESNPDNYSKRANIAQKNFSKMRQELEQGKLQLNTRETNSTNVT
ncbi:LytTR family transcriptional regulator DNA-binding domain-containing protein [Paenibacillus sp. FSL K6-3166]|uniref:LytTR family transcriptional regulator DNA-binding domain-containing protein n=1 Tax=Paenibacillus sp. FSL K6-3166 TaxID=2921492 RepID=UPI0030F4D2CA